jgi:hypothetical protein
LIVAEAEAGREDEVVGDEQAAGPQIAAEEEPERSLRCELSMMLTMLRFTTA